MRRFACLLALLVAAGCGSRGAIWEEPFAAEGPLVAADQIVWLQKNAGLLTWIDPGSGGPPRSVDVVRAPRGMAAAGGGVLVVGGNGDAPALDVVALPGGDVRRIAVGAAWDRIAVAPDGGHALLLFDPQALPAKGSAPVRNPNEIGVVDLRAGTAQTVVLQTEALVPRQVVFAPEASLAAILFDSAVAILDPADPARRVQVPLKLRDGRALRPEEAHFVPGFLFVRAAGSDDVLALAITEGADRLDVSINFLFLAGASGLRDIAVSDAFGDAVIALYADRVALLDARGAATANRSARLGVQLDRILDPGDGLVFLHAAPGSISPDRLAVAAWDPLAERVVVDRLARPIVAEPLVAGGSAFLPQDGGTTGALTVARAVRDPARLRLELQALQLSGRPTSAAVDGARGVVYLGVAQEPTFAEIDGEEIATGGGAIAAVAAGTLASGGLLVDAPVQQIGVAGDHVFAVHDALFGDVTVVPQGALRRGEAVRYEGVLASHLLDRGED